MADIFIVNITETEELVQVDIFKARKESQPTSLQSSTGSLVRFNNGLNH